MSVLIDLRVHPDAWLDPPRLRHEAVQRAGLRPGSVVAHRVVRKAIDARRGRVALDLRIELLQPGDPEVEPPTRLELPALHGEPPVVVVGAGPAGLFCAWALARHGIRSVVLDRGKPVRARRRDLAGLTRTGTIDADSNYCFGEGGAGTFSDGKLYTRAHKRGQVRDVLEVLVTHGARPDILVDARPHIGTNRLPGVITALREHLEAAGVMVRFEAKAIAVRTASGRVRGVELANGEVIPCRAVVMAPGHSARDAHRMCAEAGAQVEFKPFALGVRIEHPQAFIDRLQYGSLAGHPALGAASYRLVEQVGGRGVFSFCMCPGGFIAPAATEPGAQVVNGWSPSSRGGRFANSGFVTEVGPADLARAGLDPGDPMVGLALQARFETRAYEAGGGAFVGPAQRLDDFVAGRPSGGLPECSYPRGVQPAPLHALLEWLGPPIREALQRTHARMPGFAGPDAIAVGVESRTSCPVRVVRDESLQSPTLVGLYPCGEGTGHAGGIMSAALDGLRVAESIARAGF